MTTDSPFTLVVPTLNEAKTLPHLLEDLDRMLARAPGLTLSEAIIVDDGSTDGTLEAASAWSAPLHRFPVRVIRRPERHGPASAELEGIQAATTEWVVKLDADGQHPVDFIPSLMDRSGPGIDIVVASRYVPGGGTNWSPIRGVISRSARFMAQILMPSARRWGDPISGFFAVRRSITTQLDLRAPRYKLLLYILAANPAARVREVPFVMQDREAGSSKIVGTSLNYVVNFLFELAGYWRVSRRTRSTRPRAELVQPAAVD